MWKFLFYISNVNLRKGPGTSYSVIRQLKKQKAYIVWTEKDGWLNLGGEKWIKNNPSYVKFEKKSKMDSSIVGKRVVSKVNSLRFYDVFWGLDKVVVGTVNSGQGFIIDEKVRMDV